MQRNEVALLVHRVLNVDPVEWRAFYTSTFTIRTIPINWVVSELEQQAFRVPPLGGLCDWERTRLKFSLNAWHTATSLPQISAR